MNPHSQTLGWQPTLQHNHAWYDNLSRLLSVTHAQGSTTLDGATYTVDNAGNRTVRTPQPSGTASNYTFQKQRIITPPPAITLLASGDSIQLTLLAGPLLTTSRRTLKLTS